MKEEKEIVPMDFAEYFRKSGVSEKSKVSWNEKCCYISKSRWNVPYLRPSACSFTLSGKIFQKRATSRSFEATCFSTKSRLNSIYMYWTI